MRLRLCLLFVALGATLFAQTSGTITGSTTDKSGAVVPNARITVTNLETQVVREAVSDEGGLFSLPALPPGRYKVNISRQGFRQIVQDNVELEVNQTMRLDFQLDIGAVSETVEVKD
jgi:hypothetical protein